MHDPLLKCKSCTLKLHLSQPFHRIKVSSSLSSSYRANDEWLYLGLEQRVFRQSDPSRIRAACSTWAFWWEVPMSWTRSQVLHCFRSFGCPGHQYWLLRLWRHSLVEILCQGWFPATFNWPQTSFTFECLEFFHELTLQGKVNLYDFYHTLLQITDNANLSNTIVSYSSFVMTRFWHYFSIIILN